MANSRPPPKNCFFRGRVWRRRGPRTPKVSEESHVDTARSGREVRNEKEFMWSPTVGVFFRGSSASPLFLVLRGSRSTTFFFCFHVLVVLPVLVLLLVSFYACICFLYHFTGLFIYTYLFIFYTFYV